MKDRKGAQGTPVTPQSEPEGKPVTQIQGKAIHRQVLESQHSIVHFYPDQDSSSTILPMSQELSCELPLSHYVSSSQVSGLSTVGQKKPVSHLDYSLGDPESTRIGEGEDYFFSLFGDSKKRLARPFLKEKNEKYWKRFSMILEEVGQCRSSALGDIRISEVNVKGLFVKLINSSLDKELEIGDHILQQNLHGERVSYYRFLPNIIMPANSTVTVWAAASEAEHHPPSNFLWKELNKFETSPNYTTILCKPNGEAVAWYTPIHWKQTWEKLETDIEFKRCSIVSLTSQGQMFHWPSAKKTTVKEQQDKSKKDSDNFEMEPVKSFLKREKEIPPTLFPTQSPWCCSPDVPPHPYCTLIEAPNASLAGKQSQPQSARPDPAQVSAKPSDNMND